MPWSASTVPNSSRLRRSQVADKDYLKGGWRRKYHITKADGRPVDPKAIYFVLRLDEDSCARAAMQTYAHSVNGAGNVDFAIEIRALLLALQTGYEEFLARYRYGAKEADPDA